MKIIKKIIISILTIIVSCLLLLIAIPHVEHVNKTSIQESSHWMAQIDDELLLSNINLPGTHDSATEHVELAFFSRCQDLSVFEQLEAGFRYLDIRLAIEENQLKLMHGFTHAKTGGLGSKDLLLEDVLEDCYQFLDQYPTETIVFMVKHEYGNDSISSLQTLLYSIINQNRDYWYCDEKIPQLKQARGKIILMRRYNDEAMLGNESGIAMSWNEPQDGSVVSHQQHDFHHLAVQDMYELNSDEKWEAFQLALFDEKISDEMKIHFLSTKGSFTYGHPYSYAKTLNARFLELDLNYKNYGWIIFDFGDAKVAKHIYETNFRKE